MKSPPAQSGYLDEDLIRPADRETISLRYLLHFARADAPAFIGAIILLLLSAAATMISALAFGQLVERGLNTRDMGRCAEYALEILALEIAAVLAAFFGRSMLAGAASRAILRIRETLFHHIHRLPLSYYDRQPLGRTVTRISHDVESLETFFSASLSRLVLASVMIGASLIAMIATDLQLGAILAASTAPALAITYATRMRARDLNRQMARTNSAINARLAEYLNGISVIRAFGLEGWTSSEFKRSVGEYLRACVSTNRFYSWLRPIGELWCQLPLLILIWLGGKGIFAGTVSIGLFVTFVRYCNRFSGPITELSREVQAIQEAFSTAERVGVFLRAPTEESELGPDGAVDARSISGAIEFRGVSMGYSPTEQIIFDLTFSIPAGATIGLAGPTGSGKTSTVSLLARLYEFQQGEILLDGASVRSYTRASLRDAIGFVSQDVIIVGGTIAENLSCGRPHPREAIEAASERTGLSGVLQRSGRTLDSPLLDRGANLSEGERQLIALTRVLLAKPAVLILDEATAHIDPELERIVHSAIEAVMENRTTLIIAHRLATLRNCAHILVFKEGRIVEQGPPSAVLRGHIELPSAEPSLESSPKPLALEEPSSEEPTPLAE